MLRLVLFTSVIALAACSQTPAPLTTYGAGAGAGTSGIHTVSNGDTVYSISKRYKVDMPEMILVNSLSAPFRLNIGQRIKLPAPEKYEVRSGDNLYTVARLFNVSQSRLVDMNNLSAPYTILPGQKLRIPGTIQAQPAVAVDNFTAETITSAPVTSVARESLLSDQQPEDMERYSETIQPVSRIVSVPGSALKTTRPSFSKPGTFITPVKGKIISNYGPKSSGLHNDGINIEAPRGTPVLAAAPGEVVYAGSGLRGYGNLVLIKHGGRYLTAYGHLGEITVKKGTILQGGQKIGSVGTSGQVATPQLHFEIRQGTEALNPSKFI